MKVLILSSANGSNFEAIVKYFKTRKDIEFKLLCNNKKAKVLKRAKRLKIEAVCIEKDKIDDYLADADFDLGVMAGFFQILDKKTVENKPFLNIHPSLLPKHKGLGAIKETFYNHEIKSGITIHFATESVDEGEIIFQRELEINPKWTLEDLEKEIHKLEHFYYPRLIEKVLGLSVLVVGSGAREHVICEKISESRFLNKLYVSDANDGFLHLGEEIKYENYENLAKSALEKNVNLVIFGSEKYLIEGIVDIFNKIGIKTIGPSKMQARLEGSKIFAKKIAQKYGIKTAQYKKITDKKDIDKILSYFKNPVIKADGAALGKGVYLNSDIEKVKENLIQYLNGKFGEASKTSLIEEKLFGYEISLFSFWDGKNLLHFPLCKDFKQNSKGLNTGGLASICPVLINDCDGEKLENYKTKLKTMLKKEKIKSPFVLYSGLMMAHDDVYLLEFNVRLGDPEAQVLLNYVENDWLEIFYAVSSQMLDTIEIKTKDKQITSIVLANKGYPLEYRKNIPIKNWRSADDKIKIYFSNIIKKDDELFSNGGRLLSVVSENKNLIFKYLDKIDFEDKEYLSDISLNRDLERNRV